MAGERPYVLATKMIWGTCITLALFAVWKLFVVVFKPESFIFPAPERVFNAIASNAGYLVTHAAATLQEMLAGFAVGSVAGIAIALLMAQFRIAERIILPAIVTSQTLPVFAIAPLLVIWFGFGIGSKVVMAALIIFFPIASSFHDGLVRVDRAWLDLTRSWGAGPLQLLLKTRIPAALPSLASGLKIAATLAPIGAIVGEWAGASSGLGYVMVQANARMQTDLVFAGLLVLAVMAYAMRAIVAAVADRIIFWN
jgi:putative hydroxymethylpyrimidine transport system permease protein